MLGGRRMNLAALDDVEERHQRWRSHHAVQLSTRYVGGEGGVDQDGNAPRVFLFGEAPGATEDLRLRPFVGASGVVLRELMASAGLFTGFTPHFGAFNTWITNVIKFRPPGNRTPDEEMIMDVRHLLRAEWKAVGMPQVIIPVGGTALHALLGRKASILRHAGELMAMESVHAMPQTHSVWPMVHPRFALSEPKMQPLLEKDWLKLGKWLRYQGYVTT